MTGDDMQAFLDSIADRRDRPRKWRAMPLSEDASCEEVRALIAQCLQYLESHEFDRQAAVDRLMGVLEKAGASNILVACVGMIGLIEYLPDCDHRNFDAIGLAIADAKSKGYESQLRNIIGQHPDAWICEHFLAILNAG